MELSFAYARSAVPVRFALTTRSWFEVLSSFPARSFSDDPFVVFDSLMSGGVIVSNVSFVQHGAFLLLRLARLFWRSRLF